MQQPINTNKRIPDEVFTPLMADRRTRLRFNLSEVTVLGGDLDVRRTGWKARVRIGTAVYNVIGCPCDLDGCNCDAFIVPVPARGIAA